MLKVSTELLFLLLPIKFSRNRFPQLLPRTTNPDRFLLGRPPTPLSRSRARKRASSNGSHPRLFHYPSINYPKRRNGANNGQPLNY